MAIRMGFWSWWKAESIGFSCGSLSSCFRTGSDLDWPWRFEDASYRLSHEESP